MGQNDSFRLENPVQVEFDCASLYASRGSVLERSAVCKEQLFKEAMARMEAGGADVTYLHGGANAQRPVFRVSINGYAYVVDAEFRRDSLVHRGVVQLTLHRFCRRGSSVPHSFNTPEGMIAYLLLTEDAP